MNLKSFLRRSAILLVLLAGLAWSQRHLEASYQLPLPPLRELPASVVRLQDVIFAALGFRAAGAQMAWIQLIQYVGGLAPEDRGATNYPFLYPYTLRVVRLDPSFRRAYLFSGGLLGYANLINRPHEAIDLVKEGIHWNPTYWYLRSFLGGILAKTQGRFEDVAPLLRDAVTHPDCPPLLKSVLAFHYEQHGQVEEAMKLWWMLLNDPAAPEYHARAQVKLEKLMAQARRGPTPRP